MYKRIEPKKLSGSEQLRNCSSAATVLDFWRYAFSNLNSNVLRGALAEFYVELALRPTDEIDIRNPWGDYDVLSPNGSKIEVKCCSYIQDWDQSDYSRIVFSGLKAKELYWSEAVKSYKDLGEANYKADVYVMALFKHKEHATLDILDLDQWEFYVLSRDELAVGIKNGNSISIERLNKLGCRPVGFDGLKAATEAARG